MEAFRYPLANPDATVVNPQEPLDSLCRFRLSDGTLFQMIWSDQASVYSFPMRKSYCCTVKPFFKYWNFGIARGLVRIEICDGKLSMVTYDSKGEPDAMYPLACLSR